MEALLRLPETFAASEGAPAQARPLEAGAARDAQAGAQALPPPLSLAGRNQRFQIGFLESLQVCGAMFLFFFCCCAIPGIFSERRAFAHSSR
jgi:hypothetical protein